MKNDQIPINSTKKSGKCPINVKVSKNEKGNQWDVSIPPNEANDTSVKQYHLLLQQLTATQDKELSEEISKRAINSMPGSNEEHNVNTVYQVLSSFQPKDPIEAKLCLQSNSLYAQGMLYLSRAEKSDMLFQSDFYMKCAIKLLRLHNETIETLSRYSRKGEQRVIVQHVNVENGGKAIVGNVIAEGEGGKNN